MNGILKLNGVKNHIPVRLTLDFIDMKKIVAKIANWKLLVFLFVI